MVASSSNITVIGHDLPCGIYVLRISVLLDLELAFGCFKKGKVIHLPKAEYIYTRSDLGKKVRPWHGNWSGMLHVPLIECLIRFGLIY